MPSRRTRVRIISPSATTPTIPLVNPILRNSQHHTPHTRSATSEPSFICTICWQPQYPPANKTATTSRSFGPKILGASARIVCRACWRAVLDLSICWVCGECIVRGDEVVSLGWCFWHKGCFGCLVCGTQMCVLDGCEGDEEECREKGGGRWGSWDGSHDLEYDEGGKLRNGNSRKRKRCIGVELDEIPLCGVCEIETEGESQGEVLERSLETISKFDGGLSRDRLDMLSEERSSLLKTTPRRLARRQRRLRGATGIESELRSFINGFSRGSTSPHLSEEPTAAEDRNPLLLHAADMGISEDGSVDTPHSDSDTAVFSVCRPASLEEQGDLYVSIFDPVGEPAFRPSKTKPLPKWMSLLPNNAEREREQWQRKAAPTAVYTPSNEVHPLGKDTDSGSSNSLYCGQKYDQAAETDYVTAGDTTRRSELPSPPMNIPEQGRKKRPTISFGSRATECDSLGDGKRLRRDNRRSQTFESIYLTPPEVPRPPPRQKTPFPRMRRPSIERNESSSYFNRSINSSNIPELTDDSSCSRLGPKSVSDQSPQNSPPPLKFLNSPPLARPTLSVGHSSEYLERYQPKSPGNKHRTYVAKEPGPVIEKFKRQSSGKQKIAQMADETKEKRGAGDGGVKMKDEKCGLDLTRSELNKELRNLFNEE